MTGRDLPLEWIEGRYAVCRLDAAAPLPAWIGAARGFVSSTRTDRELSIVAAEDAVPAGVEAERGWVAMRVAGELDFALVGIIARLSTALAEAGVSVFVISTFETDVLLVKASDAGRAVDALRAVAEVSRLESDGRGTPPPQPSPA